MIERFVRALRAANVPADIVAVAEMLWLSRVVGPARAIAVPVTSAADGEPSGALPASPSSPQSASAPQRRVQRTTGPDAGVDPRLGVYADTGIADAAATVRASPLRVPRVAALPAAMEIGRALRPFGRRKASTARLVVDAERTAELSADTGILTPVLVPARERWFDVALVVDQSPSMAIWSDTAAELARLLGRHGAFRDVRRWSLSPDEDRIAVLSESGLTHHWRELVDPSARRLIVVLSDCVGAEWSRPATWMALAAWGESTPTVLVQLLPERLWRGTALESASLTVSARRPGLTNAELDVELPWWSGLESVRDTPLPVVSLEPAALGAWAQLVMGGSARIAATSTTPEERDDAPRAAPDMPPQERLRRFQELVSPTAYQLAIYLSAVPLILPVMRLVQQTMLPSSTQTHLAEFFLGGLIRIEASVDGAAVAYDFHPGVRETLQGSILRSEALRVLDTISRYLEEHFGAPLDFKALIPDAEGKYRLPAHALPFATVGARLLARVGHVAPLAPTAPAQPVDVVGSTSSDEPREVPEQPVKPMTVLVAGSVGALSPRIAELCVHLGRRLAEAGHHLMVGPRTGTDEVVARAFAETVRARGEPDARMTVYWSEPGKAASGIPINTLLPMPETARGAVWPTGADAAIFIGGAEVVARGIDILRRRDCYVLPLAATGGAAASAFRTLLRLGRMPRRVDNAMLQLLAAPLDERARGGALAAPACLADDAIEVLGVLSDPAKRRGYRTLFRVVAMSLDRVLATITNDGAISEVEAFEFEARTAAVEGDAALEDEYPFELKDLVGAGRWLQYAFERLSALQEVWPPAADVKSDVIERIIAFHDDILRSMVINSSASKSATELRDFIADIRGVKLNPDSARARNAAMDLIGIHTLEPAATTSPDDAPVPTTGVPTPLPPLLVATTLRDRSGNVRRVAWSPDGTLLAEACYDGLVRIWDPVQGIVVRVLLGATKVLYSVSWSVDGALVAAGCADGLIYCWNVASATERTIANLDRMPGSPVLSVAFSRAGEIAAGTDSGVVLAARARPMQPLGDHEGLACHTVTWAPNGFRLASCGNDHTVRLWTAERGEDAVLRGHTGNVFGVAWSPNGRYLASCSADKTVRLWDAVDGSTRAVLHGHTDTITEVAFSPDGRTLASISWDDSVRLWDVASHEEYAMFQPLSARRFHTALAFRPRGRYALAFAAGAASVIEIHGENDWTLDFPPRLSLPNVSETIALLGTDATAILDAAVRLIAGFAGSGYVLIFLDRKVLTVARRINDGQTGNYSIASTSGMIGRAFALRRVAWAADVRSEPGYIDARPSTRSELVLPMGDVGAINIEFDVVDALTQVQRDWLALFAAALGDRLRELEFDPKREIIPFVE